MQLNNRKKALGIQYWKASFKVMNWLLKSNPISLCVLYMYMYQAIHLPLNPLPLSVE